MDYIQPLPISSSNEHHVILFPFMSKGHTIPILHLALFLLRHGVAVTILTTPANRSFISHFLGDTAVSVVDLPFPKVVADVPQGIESTDKLPSFSLFHRFAMATEHMTKDFERVMSSLPKPLFLVSDGFLWWTLDSAEKFGIPRLVFFGMNAYAMTVRRSATASGILQGEQSDDELVPLIHFPWIKVRKNDFGKEFSHSESNNLGGQFIMKILHATQRSYGVLINSFYELEAVFVDKLTSEFNLKARCVGPLCLAEPPKQVSETKPKWVQWLDTKLEQGSSVLYVAFGTQADVSTEQLREIASGLEESNVNFLWVARMKESGLGDGFEERVKDRGMVVGDWVDQREILMHDSVQGFLSHCGWNSVLESICAGVPILAWPMMAEQPLNAKMVHEEIQVGLRVETCNRSVKGFVVREELKKMVRELMEGEKGQEVRERVKQLVIPANKAVLGGGSSWNALNSLIEQTQQEKRR